MPHLMVTMKMLEGGQTVTTGASGVNGHDLVRDR